MAKTFPEQLNLTEAFLHAQLPRFGDRVALVTDEAEWTYRQLADQVDRATAVFRSAGLQPEQRVLLVLPDGFAFPTAWFAAVKAGGVCAAVAPQQSVEELAYYVDYTQAKLLVVHESALPTLEGALTRCEHQPIVFVSGGSPGSVGAHRDFEAEVAAAKPDPVFARTHRDDPAVWLFTSGSTGFPKGATHKQHDFLCSAETYGLPIVGYREGDAMLSVPKLAFGYALGTNLLFPLLAGARCILFPDKSSPERLFGLIKKHRPTLLTAVPTALNAMVNSDAARQVDFSSLRLVVSAGEALPAELYSRWKSLTGVEILDGIGSAEMFHIFITNRVGDVKLGSLGRVVEGYEAKVCDDDGRELPPGEVGTLWVRGDSMALEYWREHEKSKHTFRGDWCVSADKFTRDEAGYFFFCGRGDDMLKVAGRWVSPVEVENALLTHPAVGECAVVGFKDADGLDKPKAFVVVRAGTQADDALAEALRAHVKERLAPFKAPKVVQFLEALPKSDRGKVLKSQLRS